MLNILFFSSSIFNFKILILSVVLFCKFGAYKMKIRFQFLSFSLIFVAYLVYELTCSWFFICTDAPVFR